MLHYEQLIKSEQAPWLIFVHGAGGAIATWNFQIPAFKPFFNMLLLDLRDHGLSKNLEPSFKSYNFNIVSDDILKVIDHLGIKKANFISLSLGSVVLQRLAALRPELVNKMVMAGGIFRATLKMRFFVNSAKFLDYILPYPIIYRIFSLVVLPKKNHQRSRQIYRNQAKKLSNKEYMKWVGLYGEFFKLLDDLFNKPLQQETLVVMGAEDHVFLKAATKFVEKQKKASLVVFEKCGHICNIEKWKEFNKVALQFLKENASPELSVPAIQKS